MLHTVVMAGGAGTRFWPESRARQPKQVLSLASGKTLLRATVDRLGDLTGPGRLWVATTAALAGRVVEQLPEVPVEQMVVEPCGRNTAPCIGLAAMYILLRDPEATMIVAPADHMIEPDETLRSALRLAVDLVEDDPDWIVTFGVRPAGPDEAYGYIERGERFQPAAVALGLTPDGAAADAPPVYRVRLFREKPTAERARQYVNKGTFYWNSGIFVWKAATILDALRRHQPELHQRLARIREAIGTSHLVEALRREFAAVQPLSIDHAVLEHAGETLVVEAPFRWADLGSWRSLAQLLGADAEGNTIAARHIGLGTADTIVRSTDNHLIATIGLKDLIIVHTPDATLVANRHDEQAVRELVEQLRQRGWVEYL